MRLSVRSYILEVSITPDGRMVILTLWWVVILVSDCYWLSRRGWLRKHSWRAITRFDWFVMLSDRIRVASDQTLIVDQSLDQDPSDKNSTPPNYNHLPIFWHESKALASLYLLQLSALKIQESGEVISKWSWDFGQLKPQQKNKGQLYDQFGQNWNNKAAKAARFLGFTPLKMHKNGLYSRTLLYFPFKIKYSK